MRYLRLILVLALLPPGLAAKDAQTLEQLKARAASETGSRQPVLYAEVVQREIELAGQQFDQGNSDQAHATVKDAVAFAEKCRDSARLQPKKTKEAEIGLRKAEHRLVDIRRTVALEDQADTQAAIDHIAGIRKQLLEQMFAPPQKDKQKP